MCPQERSITDINVCILACAHNRDGRTARNAEVDLLSLHIEVDVRRLTGIDYEAVGLKQSLRVYVIALIRCDTMYSGVCRKVNRDFLASLVFEPRGRDTEIIILEIQFYVRNNSAFRLNEALTFIAILQDDINSPSDGYVLETFYISDFSLDRLYSPDGRRNEKQKKYGQKQSYCNISFNCSLRRSRFLAIISATSLYSALSLNA